jgi:hypothetical protein
MIGDENGAGPVIDGTPSSSGWRIPFSRTRRGDSDDSQSRSSELSAESKAALITPDTEPSTGLDLAACRTPLRMGCGVNSVAPRYARDNYSEVSASESNCSTAKGVLCPVMHAQMVRPRLRAGAGRQRRLVRHGADRAAAARSPRAQHQLGRGHPLRWAQRRAVRAPSKMELVGLLLRSVTAVNIVGDDATRYAVLTIGFFQRQHRRANSAAKVVVLFACACFILMNITDQEPR